VVAVESAVKAQEDILRKSHTARTDLVKKICGGSLDIESLEKSTECCLYLITHVSSDLLLKTYRDTADDDSVRKELKNINLSNVSQELNEIERLQEKMSKYIEDAKLQINEHDILNKKVGDRMNRLEAVVEDLVKSAEAGIPKSRTL